MPKRRRRYGSIANELVKKAREAMLAAVQIFNNPQIEFKSELFIVTSVIAWTYLLHAFYRRHGVEYRRYEDVEQRRRYLKTAYGAVRRWSLTDCMDCDKCPLDEIVKKNLRFLIGIRHEVEHQMTSRIDDQLSAKFQASALNFNSAIKKLFGDKYGLDSEQAFSIQFSGIAENIVRELLSQPDLPQHIRSFIVQFEQQMTQEEYDDPRFSYRVAFVRKTTNSKTAADKVVQFVPTDTEAAVEINRVFLKETEKTKYRPGTIVRRMEAEGYTWFGMTQHTELWKMRDGKNPKHQWGVQVEGSWFWYEGWLDEVRKHCQQNEVLSKQVATAAQSALTPAATA
ncbi:MAG TPA: DUF3644 domain-containing protein [Terracidiphilus sp.]